MMLEPKQAIRLECLSLAVKQLTGLPSSSAEKTVAMAKAFEHYVSGKETANEVDLGEPVIDLGKAPKSRRRK